jgi:hypothetical protein
VSFGTPFSFVRAHAGKELGRRQIEMEADNRRLDLAQHVGAFLLAASSLRSVWRFSPGSWTQHPHFAFAKSPA